MPQQFSIRLHGPLLPLQGDDGIVPQSDSTTRHRRAAELGVDALCFDQALGELPGLYLEPDGSFLWSGQCGDDDGSKRWKIEGTWYEREGMIQFVELSGNCSFEAWEHFLMCLKSGWRPSVAERLPRENHAFEDTLSVHELIEDRWYLLRDFVHHVFEST